MSTPVLELSTSLRAELSRFEPDLMSGEDCRKLAEDLARTEKACAAARARAAARVSDCGTFRTAGFGDAAEWLSRTTGTSRGEAAAQLKTVSALGSCPHTAAAALAGELSLAQAGEIARTEAECPGAESDLVVLARGSGLAALRDEGRKRRLGAIPAEELAARQRKARTFRHWRDELGMVRFSGALEPVVGVPIVHRIDAECDRIRRAARREGSVEPREAFAADAFAKLLSGQGTPSARRADVVFVCDLRAYRRGHAEEGEQCHVIGGGPVPVSAVRDAIDDAFVKAVTHDGVRIDTVVHYGRHIGAALRTALDLGHAPDFEGAVCATPGCGWRWGLEWDHVDPVANGGPTSFANLEGLCPPCHRAKTEADRRAGLLGNRGRVGEEEPASWDEEWDEEWDPGWGEAS
ncbi:MAG: HNH endonuclease signature motif containing protein [Actinomycetota bacterium]